jgi:outer membrane protein assembly factor BamD (BamD/ComL family)
VRFAGLLGAGLLACSLSGCLSTGDQPFTPEKVAAAQQGKVVDKNNPEGDGNYIAESFVNNVPTTLGWGISGNFKDLGWDLSVRHWNWFGLMHDDEPPPPPVNSLVLRGDGMEEAKALQPGTAAYRLAGAHELLRQGQYAKAERIFHRIAENEKNPARVVEEARYYEAECLRLQRNYPEAADVYADLMTKFPQNPFREQAVQHMFDIANYWLEDTRQEMKEAAEVREGKHWFVWHQPVHFDRTKPVFDEAGRAVELLEKVQLNDITGPLSDKALFLCGGVKYYEMNFAEADYYFSQIHEQHPNSPLAPQAVELGIVAKNLSTGGSDYDGRKSAEARILVNAALNNYPELAGDPQKQEDLIKQLKNITYQQAEKDYKMAEFWAWTGHPGSAYFYFELVRRRYPGTKFAEMATVRRDQLREAAEKEEAKKPGKIAPPVIGNPPAGAAPPPQKLAPGEIAPPPVLPPELRGAPGW